MAVRGNIGKISALMRAAKRAEEAINYGLVEDPYIDLINYSVSGWSQVDVDRDVFIFGIHKWGSATYKVTK